MTTDLWMLVATGLLSAFIPLVYGAGRFQVPGGAAWAFGNRDTTLPVAPWVSRAVRAHLNLTENIAAFAILVLVAHVAGKANGATAMGATLFFIGRVLHLITYTAGFIYVRTAVFFLAVTGEILILVQLFR
jgi:uncharacterized MAPEG superfamily protein